MQKKTNTIKTKMLNSPAISAGAFRIFDQFKKELMHRNKINMTPIIMLKIAYVVLTYVRASLCSPLAIASASLFLNPLPKPISKNPNQPIIELNVNQIPRSEERRVGKE